MNVFEILRNLEDSNEIHLARLLILLRAFAGRKGNKTINGLTKLVKLDFLLRYPAYLERALEYRDATANSARVMDHERKSVESRMIRYHYGPWDPRYRLFINILVGKGLAHVSLQGRTIIVGLTEVGLKKTSELSKEDIFEDIGYRAHLLKRHFDMSATRLKNFIYETFPEIISLRLGEEIKYEY